MTTPTLRPWRVAFPDGNDLVIMASSRREALLTAHELCGPDVEIQPHGDW